MLARSTNALFPDVTHGNCGGRVLGEQDALEFDDEEVDELLSIIESRLKSLLRNLVVLTRAESGSDALSHDEFASDFSKSSHCHNRLE